jgi:hypothetical protein
MKKLECEILVPMPSTGKIILSAKFMEKYLKAEKGDKVLVVPVSDNAILLKPFDPTLLVADELAKLKGEEEGVEG